MSTIIKDVAGCWAPSSTSDRRPQSQVGIDDYHEVIFDTG